MPRGKKGTPTQTSTSKTHVYSQPLASPRATTLRDQLFSGDLTVPELAHILNRSCAAVTTALRSGTIAGYRIGRSWRVTEEAVRQYVATLRGVPSTTVLPSQTIWGSGTVTYPSVTHPVGSTIPFQVKTNNPSGDHDVNSSSRSHEQVLTRFDQNE